MVNVIIYIISILILCIIILFKDKSETVVMIADVLLTRKKAKKSTNKEYTKFEKFFIYFWTTVGGIVCFIFFVVFPFLDLFFCIDIKTSEILSKNITITSLEKEMLYSFVNFEDGREHNKCEMIKVISSEDEEYYIFNEELEKHLKSNQDIKASNEIKYVKTFRGDFIVSLEPKV